MTLRDEVIIAFSKVPYPGDEALTSCNCDECRWEVGRFKHGEQAAPSASGGGAAAIPG